MIDIKHYKYDFNTKDLTNKESNSYNYIGDALSLNINYQEDNEEKTINLNFLSYLLIDNYQNQLSIRFADITPYNFISSNKKDINKQYRSFTMEDTGTCKFKLVDNKQVEFENYEHLLNQILEFINLNFTHIKNNIDIKSKVIYKHTDLESHEIEVKDHFKLCFLKEISDNKNLYNYIKNHYLFKKLNNDLSNKNKATKHKI